jgi:hypothetical protein
VETIRFFIAVTVSTTEPILESIAKRIESELNARRIIQRPAVYMGDGFCNVLIKGEASLDHYFSIGKLTKWIRGEFSAYGATTETYLVSEHEASLSGTDKISNDFYEPWRDPFVESIIPEDRVAYL